MISIFIVYEVERVEMSLGHECYCTSEMSVVFRVLRNEMGALF
jgi:hypothetical protein